MCCGVIPKNKINEVKNSFDTLKYKTYPTTILGHSGIINLLPCSHHHLCPCLLFSQDSSSLHPFYWHLHSPSSFQEPANEDCIFVTSKNSKQLNLACSLRGIHNNVAL